MNYDDLIRYYGGESQAATAVGYDRQRVHKWKKTGKVPTDAQLDYEVQSKGGLKADLPEAVRTGNYETGTAQAAG